MITYSASSDIKRALSAKGFLFGIAGMVLMITVASINSIVSIKGVLANGYHAQLILTALTSEDVALVLPILCTLPFAAVFVDDIKSGFIKQYLPRSGVPAYIKGKILASSLSGGLVLVAGLFIAYGVSALVFTPMEAALEADQIAQPYFAEIFTKSLTLFLSGAFWSLTGFTLASTTMSRYMAYASPFVLYYVLIILHERYFADFYVLYPKEWMAMSQPWVLENLGVWILLLVLCAVIGLLFSMMAKRRLENV